ncbi:MAG: TonB-dependent receptor plug domain-containing protein, partial [Parcubacteria group bacterium]
MPTRKTTLLAASGLAGAAALLAVPAAALAQQASQVQELVVTGSRLPPNEFTSASPVQVLNADDADVRGILDTGRFLQGSTLAAGSTQVNPTISYALVEPGGAGVSTLSLRGLGPTRTLILLNGRRAGPAGTRGEVSSVDLNTIPMSSVQRVEILKDGASSIYGSDAIAGVVNVITRQNRDGGSASVDYSGPFEGGGEALRLSGDFGKTFDGGWVHASGEYYRQEELAQGERDYTRCAEQYVFDPATGARSDAIDPRTGHAVCRNQPWGQVYPYAIQSLNPPKYQALPGAFQYDYDGALADAGIPATGPGYPGVPAGFYLVGYDRTTLGLQNAHHPFQDRQSLIPRTERKSVFLEGAYQLTPQAEAYGELLLTRRESRKTGFRTFWPVEITLDPFNAGFTGLFGLQPVIPTDHAGFSERVDHTRLVAGVRGAFAATALDGWKWDVFVQHSRSDGRYTNDQILNDAIDSQSFMSRLLNGPCAGATLPISGRTCMDISFTDPRVLAGDLTAAEQAFLFDRETGKTVYTQDFIEGSVAGNAFDLPAGPMALALGFHYRKDELRDTPGPITLAGNAWGRSGGGITAGSDVTGELFAEAGVPLIADAPLAKKVELTLSTRWTDVQSTGNATTYKAGLNWALTPEYRLRATWGTSFRAPALYELYLAHQTSFLSEAIVDPCVMWGARLATGSIPQRVADNCQAAGVPNNFPPIGSATIIEGGGAGHLKPETSEAFTLGFVWTPAFAPLSVAVDYFDIDVKDEVTSLGQQIPLACYNSPNFPADPVCGLFERDSNHRLDNIRADFINIAEQTNRGIDLTVAYRQALPWNLGEANLDGQFTWQLEKKETPFAGYTEDRNGLIGEPDFVGDVTLAIRRGPWTVNWATDMIGHQGNYAHYGSDMVSVAALGGAQRVKAHAEFTAFHTVSLQRDVNDWSVRVGVANLFDEHPPAVTTVGSGLG